MALVAPRSFLLYARLHFLGGRGAWVLWRLISGFTSGLTGRRRDRSIYDADTLLYSTTLVLKLCIEFS
jgi:hypothetical protein